MITQFEKGYGIPVLTEIGGAIEQAAIQKHNNELEAQTAAIEEYINFRRFDGLLPDPPKDKKSGTTLSSAHSSKNYTNLSHWLLQQLAPFH